MSKAGKIQKASLEVGMLRRPKSPGPQRDTRQEPPLLHQRAARGGQEQNLTRIQFKKQPAFVSMPDLLLIAPGRSKDDHTLYCS